MRQIDISQDATAILEKEFTSLHSGGGRSSIAGGQSAADHALAQLDISGYAKNRSQVLPHQDRGASVLSPYIRHNILSLQRVWDHVAKAPFADREKYRDELMWQEYARHLYARIGTRRNLTVYLGDPYQFTRDNSVAVTYAPVPSFAKFENIAELHPYQWLRTPHAKSVRSFSAWRGK